MKKIVTPWFLIFIAAFVCSKAVVNAEEKGNDTPQKQTRPENASPSQAGSTVVEMNESEAPADLNRLVQEALEHNPEIIAAQKRVNAAKARISQAKSLDDPTIRAGSYDMSNSPVNVNGQTEMLQQRYGVSQKIPFPGKLRLRGEVAAEETNMTEKEFQAKMLEITAMVKSAFYELNYVNSAIDVTEENRELLRKFAKIAETKYSVGKATQRDALAAQVELSTLANNVIVLNKERESIVAQLNILLDRPTQAVIGKPRRLEKRPFKYSLGELENLAVHNRPELKKYDHAVKRNEANLKLSKKEYYYADFEPMVEYMQEDKRSDTWASSISVNIPWLWPKNRAKVKESKEDLSAAKSDYRAAGNKALFEVKDYFVRIRSAESTINLYATGVIPQSEQSLKAAQIGYESDRVDFLSLIDSQRILLNSKLLYCRALTDFEQMLAKLENAVGMPLM
ncbi:MAG TPA: TolC family protein [Candidatus Brocadiaceae bacterium]|nr:TolC family protein [Candidatus Brocadiaceae bacterium]